MKTLIIDSATNILYTALLVDKDKKYESYVLGKNDHASAILVEIEKACKTAELELKNLDCVVVGYGPGSYTGVRMGVTIGKLLATLEKNIKLYTLSTLLFMASGSKGQVLSTIDARRGNVFGCIYDMNTMNYVVQEALVEKSVIEHHPHTTSVDENHFVVDPFKVVTMASYVAEPRTLVPNYLRQTEAERNLNA
jgi:universal bacterial protein YeaZ